MNAFNSKEEEEIKTCEYYHVKPKKDKNELFIYDKEELLNLEFADKITIYYGGDLTEVLIWLKYTLKYHPQIRYSKSLTNILLKINDTIVNLTNHDITFNEDETEIRCKDEKVKTDYMKLYKKHDNEFMNGLLSKNYLSTYSDSLKHNLFNFPISCAVGNLKCNIPKEQFAIDFTKAYSSILYESKFIPVATPFDEFEK